MRDAVVMWRNPRMVVLTAVCAAMYVAVLVPFKFLVIFPGLAEVRPAAALPVVFSLLFGPAAAWGSAFGNVVGDMLGGMFGPGSVFGFIANFAYGYIPYKLWEAVAEDRDVGEELKAWRAALPDFVTRPGRIGLVMAIGGAAGLALVLAPWKLGAIDPGAWLSWQAGEETRGLGPWAAVLFGGIAGALGTGSLVYLIYSPKRILLSIFYASLACACLLGWGVDLLGFVPFRFFAGWILANNLVMGLLLAPPLVIALHPRVASRFMLYGDLLDGEKRASVRRRRLGAAILSLSLICFLVVGMHFGTLGFETLIGSDSSYVRGLAFSPFVALIFLGLILL